MPNWLHIALNGLYHLGLALWIGGAVSLGALVAPALFRALPRPDAGAIFGPVLRRFAYVRLGGVALAIAGAGAKHIIFEAHANTIWIALRWLLLAFLAIVVVYEIASLHPRIEKRGDDFARLHKRSERLMKASLVVAVMALFLS